MTSHYFIDSWELDNALNGLHTATETMKTIKPVMRMHGDAQWIWDDVCDLIELLGRITTFVPDEKIKHARLALMFLEDRRRETITVEAAE
jgi:hypothetical protein